MPNTHTFFADIINEQMRKAGKPRTTTREVVQQQPTEGPDISSMLMMLMFSGLLDPKSQGLPGTEAIIPDYSYGQRLPGLTGTTTGQDMTPNDMRSMLDILPMLLQAMRGTTGGF